MKNQENTTFKKAKLTNVNFLPQELGKQMLKIMGRGFHRDPELHKWVISTKKGTGSR